MGYPLIWKSICGIIWVLFQFLLCSYLVTVRDCCSGSVHGFLQFRKRSALWGAEVMLVGISDEKRVLPADKCRSPVGGHEKGLSPSWISYPLMQFLDEMQTKVNLSKPWPCCPKHFQLTAVTMTHIHTFHFRESASNWNHHIIFAICAWSTPFIYLILIEENATGQKFMARDYWNITYMKQKTNCMVSFWCIFSQQNTL